MGAMGLRFLFGATIAVAAGLVSLRFGARVGGLLLAFPAILPASLTLIAKQDGRSKASIDAMGAVLGALAMVGFALTAHLLLPPLGLAALVIAGAGWLLLAVALYFALRGVMALFGRVPAGDGRTTRRS